MAHSTGYIIGFASAVCVVCSVGVASAAMGLRDMQQANELNAFRKKVLEAVDLPAADDSGRRPRLNNEEVADLFKERTRLILVDLEGEEVMAGASDEDKLQRVDQARRAVRNTGKPPEVSPVYLRVSEEEAVEGYAIELQGRGLWGPISGFLALEPNAETVMNVSFDPQKETPGLGAEIAQPPFMRQWRGKSIRDERGLTEVRVVKGSAALACPGRVEHCVDGVSGATITSRGVDDMVRDAVKENYAAYLKQLQTGS
ncbi:MAG: NADH:ubiquinone reductase (Na(+)-transporting) subunit C [Deltaproteobacteria bacterium]|nr:MAG: NADH:ubiquinone reductase (Na(+)-transporting) subunit C [Deltaproteobacteria bacterium]